MDVDYIIRESRRMGRDKAIRYLSYHFGLQEDKRERLKKKIAEINQNLDRLYDELQRREFQTEIVLHDPSSEMGESEKKEEEVKERE